MFHFHFEMDSVNIFSSVCTHFSKWQSKDRFLEPFKVKKKLNWKFQHSCAVSCFYKWSLRCFFNTTGIHLCLMEFSGQGKTNNYQGLTVDVNCYGKIQARNDGYNTQILGEHTSRSSEFHLKLFELLWMDLKMAMHWYPLYNLAEVDHICWKECE